MQNILLFILFIPFLTTAQLRVAKIFSDNMVLQRDAPVHVWGKGIPGKTVSVSVSQSKNTAKVKADSSWSIVLAKQKAAILSKTITIVSGSEKIELKNVLFGDLWVCIGQSNMEWPMIKEMHFKEELSGINQPLLRFYNPGYAGKNVFGSPFSDSIVQRLNINDFYRGKWETCNSNSVNTMSAVAYYFGKRIAHDVNVPVGLIHLAIGGAPLETFISIDALMNDQKFSSKAKGNWLTNDALPVWARERGKQNVGGKQNVLIDDNGPAHGYKPGFAFEAGVAPFVSLPVKGIICYQGESNAQEQERVNEYPGLMALMINDYRKKWKQPSLPFYFVQLSSIDTATYKSQLWPQFRDEQRKALSLIKFSGMAVSSDIGSKNDVHPTDKKTVGERLARWALNKTYHLHIIPGGPLPLNATYVNDKVIITFQSMAKGLKTSDSQPLRGFSIDGKNEAVASFGDSGVLIPVKAKPEYVYYGWTPFSHGNLINSEQLPASTFKIKVQ